MLPRRHTLIAFVLIALAAGCGGSGATTSTSSTTTTSPSSTTTSTTTATTVPETTTSAPGEPLLLLPSVSEFGPGWSQVLYIPYGPGEEELGTAPGGDAGTLELGPDYGAQAADGSWWILDAAKLRLAHYAEDGSYLGAVAMKPEHLAQGQYFQFQLPHILDDGTLVAQNMGGDITTLLLMEDGDTRVVTVPVGFGSRFDDGSSLFGFAGEGRERTRVDPHTGSAETVEWFLTRAGTRFGMEIRGDELTIELPDAPDAPTLTYRLAYADDPTVPAYGLLEAASGADGTLFLYIIGGTDSGVGGQLAGFFTVSPDGTVSPVEPTRDPFTSADPGSPGQLGVRPGTGSPWIMIIDTDGVRVFGRS